MVGSLQLRELHERLYEANERRIRELVSTPRRFTYLYSLIVARLYFTQQGNPTAAETGLS